VNELLTNTIKYAFPQRQNGNVILKLEHQNNGILHLEVSDNGIVKSGNVKGIGLGSQWLSLLTWQLGGKTQEEVNNGTNVFVDFKLDKLV
jgi:two-component sensor histidine kinase